MSNERTVTYGDEAIIVETDKTTQIVTWDGDTPGEDVTTIDKATGESTTTHYPKT